MKKIALLEEVSNFERQNLIEVENFSGLKDGDFVLRSDPRFLCVRNETLAAYRPVFATNSENLMAFVYRSHNSRTIFNRLCISDFNELFFFEALEVPEESSSDVFAEIHNVRVSAAPDAAASSILGLSINTDNRVGLSDNGEAVKEQIHSAVVSKELAHAVLSGYASFSIAVNFHAEDIQYTIVRNVSDDLGSLDAIFSVGGIDQIRRWLAEIDDEGFFV